MLCVVSGAMAVMTPTEPNKKAKAQRIDVNLFFMIDSPFTQLIALLEISQKNCLNKSVDNYSKVPTDFVMLWGQSSVHICYNRGGTKLISHTLGASCVNFLSVGLNQRWAALIIFILHYQSCLPDCLRKAYICLSKLFSTGWFCKKVSRVWRS